MQTEREYRDKLRKSHINLLFYAGPPRSGKSTTARTAKSTEHSICVDADAARRALARRGQYDLPYDAAQERAVLYECMVHMEQAVDAYLHRAALNCGLWVHFVDTSWCETAALRAEVQRVMQEHFKMDVYTVGVIDADTALSVCMQRLQWDNRYLAPIILRSAVRGAFDTFLTTDAASKANTAELQALGQTVQEFCERMDEHALNLR